MMRPDREQPVSLTIRTMSRQELELALDWAAAEGWNPGLGDATPFQVADPLGFRIALVDDAPVGSISVVRYTGGFGFLGFYIVAPPWRGQGFGRRLWEESLTHLDGCTVGLDGVVAQQENYRRSGFAYAWPNYRFGGTLDGRQHPGLHDARSLPFAAILALDETFFPASRPGFLAAWLAVPASHSLALVDDGVVVGLGTIRRCRDGHKVGPLYAPDRAGALRLLQGLAAGAAGETIFWDVPGPNTEAMALADELGLVQRFETARMYRGAAPELPLERLFGITSFELG